MSDHLAGFAAQASALLDTLKKTKVKFELTEFQKKQRKTWAIMVDKAPDPIH